MCSSNTSYSFTVKSNYFLHILSLSSSALKLLAPRSLTPLISVLHAFSVALLPVDYSLLKYPFLAATYSYIWPMSFGALSLHFLRVLSWALMVCTLWVFISSTCMASITIYFQRAPESIISPDLSSFSYRHSVTPLIFLLSVPQLSQTHYVPDWTTHLRLPNLLLGPQTWASSLTLHSHFHIQSFPKLRSF